MRQLNLIVDQYLSFAELQAQQKKPMHMAQWIAKLHDFLTLNDREILRDAGKVTHDLAKDIAGQQFEKFDAKRRAFEASNPISDFDKQISRLSEKRKKLKPDDPSK